MVKNIEMRVVFMRIKNFLKKYIIGNDIEYMNNDISKSWDKEAHETILLSVYESRKKEIQESSRLVEGIFYIYNGQIIPDFYSECLVSDVDNPCRKDMYHMCFYPNYMKRKFRNLSYSEKSIPRGRILGRPTPPVVFIDKCYEKNMDIISQLKNLYRLPENVLVLSGLNYCCPDCSDEDQ